jgi:predicted NUDIX family NTP pyrophosphohydrolase
MLKTSAGLLLFRFNEKVPEVMLVHPGGPFWAKKDLGAWSVPKGEFEPAEEPLDAAKRELQEETGIVASGDFIKLQPVKQKSGKIIHAWAVYLDADVAQVKSNMFEMEWPPESGQKRTFPEIDKAAWFKMEEAERKIVPGQLPLLNELKRNLAMLKK